MEFSTALTYAPLWFTSLIATYLGLCIGSFLNVVIYRIPIGPLKRISGTVFNINHPRSHCPACSHQLAWYENIPLFSWLYQKARCKHCNISIPARYPAVELFVGCCTLIAWSLSQSLPVLAFTVFACMLIVPLLWWVLTKSFFHANMIFWCLIMLSACISIGFIWILN